MQSAPRPTGTSSVRFGSEAAATQHESGTSDKMLQSDTRSLNLSLAMIRHALVFVGSEKSSTAVAGARRKTWRALCAVWNQRLEVQDNAVGCKAYAPRLDGSER